MQTSVAQIMSVTQCCDEYECACNCVNSTVSCPLGYLASAATNDCGCTTTTCLPDKLKGKCLLLNN
ncbi:hypothetical protein P7K49_036146 [Saguinus oedipus]|uniref:Metallothionein n=1 Tax=Saguinus oedipus TaxID=9490 RepID=A0ABQ9TQ03_SAGOE|nr:hypothetical protein P7K49_036146 [Saguinus oedipus]